MAKTETIGRAHTLRVMPTKEQQKVRQILMALGGVVLVFVSYKYLQITQQSDLVSAARAGNVAAVRSVLDGGIFGLDRTEAMEAAVRASKGNVVRYLLSKRVDPNPGLEEAARRGQGDILRLLVENGGNVRGERGGHLLHLAAQSGDKEAVYLLLQYGANREALNQLDDAMTPLHYAARSGKSGVVKLLLDQHANYRATTLTGRTALMLAAAWNEAAACKYLIDAGADINARDSKGMTALMQASVVGHSQTVAYLLSRGASTKIRDAAGKTALNHATELGDTKVCNLLRQAIARAPAPRLATNLAKPAGHR